MYDFINFILNNRKFDAYYFLIVNSLMLITLIIALFNISYINYFIFIFSITMFSNVAFLINMKIDYTNFKLKIIVDNIYTELQYLHYEKIYVSKQLSKYIWYTILIEIIVDSSLKKYEYSYTKKSDIIKTINDLYG